MNSNIYYGNFSKQEKDTLDYYFSNWTFWNTGDQEWEKYSSRDNANPEGRIWSYSVDELIEKVEWLNAF